jgi:hypothetical protein
MNMVVFQLHEVLSRYSEVYAFPNNKLNDNSGRCE